MTDAKKGTNYRDYTTASACAPACAGHADRLHLPVPKDMCDFGTIKRYFHSPTSEISQVMIVQEPYGLEVIGAFFVHPSGHIGLQLGGLFARGIVKAPGHRPDR